MTEINAEARRIRNPSRMALPSTFGRQGFFELSQQADQFEQLATFMSRPDGRVHMLERAAECRARAALIQAAARSAWQCAA